jgi:exodeoxyribonuclease VII small subunit
LQRCRAQPFLKKAPLAQTPLSRYPVRIMSDSLSGLSFEDALAELERIVRGLEGGQQKLEDAITCYERGTALRRHCEAKLAEAEARVQAIVEQADGSLSLKTAD